MAKNSTLRRKPTKRGTYYVSMIGGKLEYFGNVKTTTQKEAQKAFAKMLANHHAGVASPVTQRITVTELCDRYLLWLNDNKSKVNADSKRSTLQRWCDHKVPAGLYGAGKTIGELQAQRVDRPHMEHFVNWLVKEAIVRAKGHGQTKVGYSPKATDHFIQAIKAAWNWASGHNKFFSGGLLPKAHRPLADFPRVVIGPKDLTEHDLISPVETKALLEAAKPFNHGLADILEVYFHCGARTGELFNAQVRDYSPTTGRLTLGKHKRAKTQTNSTMRTIILNDKAKAIIEKRITGKAGTDNIFTRSDDGLKWNGARMTGWMKKACEAAGVRSFTPYDFRHLYISQCLMAGVSIFHVSKLAGTSVREIQRTYGHFYDADLEAAQATLDAARE